MLYDAIAGFGWFYSGLSGFHSHVKLIDILNVKK